MAARKNVTLTDAQLNDIIAKAVAEALATKAQTKKFATPTRKSTKSATAKTSKSPSTKKSATKSTTRKSTTRKTKVEVEPLDLVYDDDAFTVEFSRFVRNRNVFGFVDKVATESGATREKGGAVWTFKGVRAYNKFCKSMEDVDVSALTDEQLQSGHEFNSSKASNASKYTDEQKSDYKARYQQAWDKYVADCEKKGIKRTSEMNRAKSAEIRKALAQ